ncbi:hypothetical protein AB0F42_05315 [Streptomyces buecherae]|uniref:hypothetical protein n=1 Tax=Streptomyces buecherae TaxID=2763006 RepID=UPI0033D22C28
MVGREPPGAGFTSSGDAPRENAIDFGHFAASHRRVVDITDPPRFEGARRETAYRLGRAAGYSEPL